MLSPAVSWHEKMRHHWLVQGLAFSRYGRPQGLSRSMEKDPEHWGRALIRVVEEHGQPRWRSREKKPDTEEVTPFVRSSCANKGIGQQGQLSATAPSDPRVPAGPEFVDLQYLIRTLTKHCVWGRCLGSCFEFSFCRFIWFGLFGFIARALVKITTGRLHSRKRNQKINNYFGAETGERESWILWNRRKQRKK